MKKSLTSAAIFSFVLAAGSVSAVDLTTIEDLGKKIYESNELSLERTQSCATCHHRTSGFADPTNSADPENVVVSLGDDGVSTGGRNAPTSAYCGFSPVLHQDANGEYVGGMFWDGRATGWTLGDPLAEQAQGPPLNPVEMNMPDKATIIDRMEMDATIGPLFRAVFGEDAFADVDAAYDNLARAIAAYERSADVTRFTSNYDRGIMTTQQMRGKMLFMKNCNRCHAMGGHGMGRHGSGHSLFTNYKYVNAGVPENPMISDPNNPDDNDLGLGGFLGDPAQNGKFKVPTLRNVELTAPYSHNGSFATLEEMVAFMNDNSGFEPEVAANVSTAVGNLGLTEAQRKDIVAFLKTLTDN